MIHRAAPTLPAAVEQRRLEALRRYEILDTPPETVFDDITRIAAQLCGVPMALISLVETERQWFKSEHGLGARQTPIEGSICAHALLQDDLLVVPDTHLDARFVGNPLVVGEPGLRFYAGALLKTPDGLPIGTVCVLDTVPNAITEEQGQALRALARQVMAQLELRRMLALSERTSQYRAGLLASAGHDFRTPMTTAMLAFDLARDAPPERMERVVSMGQEALRNVDNGLTRMLSAASGKNTFELEQLVPTPLHGVLEHVVSTQATAAGRRGLQLRMVATRASALTHPRQLETLLGNLVANAVKYTPRGGKVLIGVRRRRGQVEIEVVDTGRGIAEDQIEHMFGAFRQPDHSRDGLGLGLWIVQKTAASLGIGLRVYSVPGTGTRFVMEMPSAVDDAGDTDALPAEMPASVHG
ncbi:Signal transduction histidine kinase [Pseudoxanthomonas sp. GM95]|uniref:sensor histidine kinase n=1 Tax=Pseudoxanthomonas sp. GM95 TaxID=1881043 RepID=UPI0008C3044F|nr:GAF domain-containing sensor histidine kinase [Pseudoxanthomonas sp. GM95]SEL53500.1 Signal transduction histidine kinase [Pseudoxanthomonas sp. GM95]